MRQAYDSQAHHETITLRVNSDLLSQCMALDINLSAALELALAQLLIQKQQERWLHENRTAIAAYNDDVATHDSMGHGTQLF